MSCLKCLFCCNLLEDEFHFVIECPLYQDLRVIESPLYQDLRVIECPLYQDLHVIECPLYQDLHQEYIKRYFWARLIIPKFSELLQLEN